jgi:drug/metabolite transporter (DMT)-like permease
MIIAPWLWAVFTVIAAGAQTVRNAAQHELTHKLGTVGATHVRFLFGLPFALVFLAGVAVVLGRGLPRPDPVYWLWVIDGAGMQFAATTLMLLAMGQSSFVVTIAYIKTEPISVALFGLVLLGDPVTLPMAIAIATATAGVVLMSIKPGAPRAGLQPMLMGLGAGGLFALSAIGFRGAILNLHEPSFVMAATFTLVIGLLFQSVVLTTYLYVRSRHVLFAIARAWRPSLFAGFMGALASQFWYLAFAIATAANVRTLALVEQPTSRREAAGIVLIVVGVLLLIWAY